VDNRGEILARGGTIRPEELATFLATKVLEKKARDVVILDMQGLASYTDVFVICSATNRRQVKAIAAALREAARDELALPPPSTEGLEAGRWALVDFNDVVVHIFDEALRGFYDLDGLWGDAPHLPLPEVEGVDADPAEPTYFTF